MTSGILKRVAEVTEGRFFEWVASVILLCMAIHIMIFPTSLQSNIFKYAMLTMNGVVPSFVLIALAVVRIGALVVNGRSDVTGPRVRAWGSLLGAIIFFQMVVSMIISIADDKGTASYPSMELPIILPLFIAELYSAFRAATDVRISNRDI